MKIQLPISDTELKMFNVKSVIFGTWGPLNISDSKDLITVDNASRFAKVVTITKREIKYHFSPKVTTISNSKKAVSVENFDHVRISVSGSRFYFYSKNKAYQVKNLKRGENKLEFTINEDREVRFINPFALQIKRI